MDIIKVRFIRYGAPAGKPYVYYSPVHVVKGTKVSIDGKSVAVVVDPDVPEEEVESFKDKIKVIVGIVNDESGEQSS